MTAEQCHRVLAALGAVLLLVAGCTGPASPDQQSVSAVPTTSAAAEEPTSAAASGALASPTASPAAEAEEDAATALVNLPVKDRAWGPKYPKYDRHDLFLPKGELGEFDSDRNGCDQRNDLLARQLTGVRLAADGCEVRSGTVADPYSGHTFEFRRGADSNANDFEIDHVVALADAWWTGAQQWTPEQRHAFATDVRDQQVTETATNLDKGYKDAFGWLPDNAAYRCTYVARQIEVKAVYGLWVTPPEHDKMDEVLHGCPGQRLPGTL
jgi:hypothetical protein